MLKIVYAIGILLLIGVFHGCCMATHDVVHQNTQSVTSGADDRVQIVFGPSRPATLSFVQGQGPVFLWGGLAPVSEESFCAGIAEESAKVNHIEIVLNPSSVSDISVREFINKLAYLRYLCLKNLAPNATATLYVCIAVSPESASTATSTSPAGSR